MRAREGQGILCFPDAWLWLSAPYIQAAKGLHSAGESGPSAQQLRFGTVKCELLVQVHDGAPQVGSLHLVQSLFDLSGRELQVVRLLAEGHSVDSLPQCMKISPNTARTHLRSIFSKTGTSRQSELIQLCVGLANA